MEQFQLSVFPNSSEESVTRAALMLTPSEKNYGQIEELILALAIIYAVKKYPNTSREAISHRPQITTRYCPFSAGKIIPTYSTNLLTRQNSGTKIRKATDFGQADGRNVIVSIAIENDKQSNPDDSIRNIPLIA